MVKGYSPYNFLFISYSEGSHSNFGTKVLVITIVSLTLLLTHKVVVALTNMLCVIPEFPLGRNNILGTSDPYGLEG